MKKKLFIFILAVPLLINFIYLFFISKRIGDGFLGIYDSAILLTLNEVNKKLGLLWVDYSLGLPINFILNVGIFSYLYSFILLKLGFGIKAMQLILYFIFFNGIFYGSWHAFFLIQKRLFNNNNIGIPFIAAFFYTYNLVVSSLLGVIDTLFLILFLSPYLIYILIVLFNKQLNLKLSLLLAIIFALTIYYPPFSLAIYIPLFISYFFMNFKALINKANFSYLVLSIVVFLFLASPFIFILINTITFVNPYSKGPSISADGFIFPPGGVLGIFSFYFNWVIYYFQSKTNFYFKSAYGILSSFAIWGIILTTIILYWEKINKKKELIFILLSLLIALFLSKGVQAPFSEINQSMYNLSPFFAIFRTSGSKFGISAMLFLSTLIVFILNVNKKRSLLIILILCVFMQTWIFFNQENIIGFGGNKRNDMIVKIPKEYEEIIQVLNSSKKEGRLLFVPGENALHFDLGNNNQYSGQDMLGKYIERPVIYPDYSIYLTFSKNIVNKILETFDPVLVGSTSIRYIAVRKDFDIRFSNQYKEVEKIIKLLKKENYRQIYDSKLMTLFEINDIYYQNYISIKKGSFFIVPRYKKLSSYEYTITVKPKDLINNQLIFRSSYHPDWIMGDLKDSGLILIRHELYDNYANMWTFKSNNNSNNSDKLININIYYEPQKKLNNLFLLSGISFIVVITSLIVIKIYEKKNRPVIF